MSIKDSIQKAKEGSSSRAVYKAFYEWYDNLSEQDRQDLDEALLSDEVSTRQLFYALKENEGVKFGSGSLYYHAKALSRIQEK